MAAFFVKNYFKSLINKVIVEWLNYDTDRSIRIIVANRALHSVHFLNNWLKDNKKIRSHLRNPEVTAELEWGEFVYGL